MPVYRLVDHPVFPPPELAEPDGLLAIGGDLSPPRLLLAYSSGIFPWYNEGEPILWWSPDPRCIFEPQALKISRSLHKTVRQKVFSVTFDKAFRGVIAACAQVRRKQEAGTWITGEMLEAFCRLHQLGYAHSVECWQDGVLAGGLYGVCLGRCFFGESMFHLAPDASKVALAVLAETLRERNFELIDGQLPNPHLRSLGAREIPRPEFLQRLRLGGVFPSTQPPLAVFP